MQYSGTILHNTLNDFNGSNPQVTTTKVHISYTLHQTILLKFVKIIFSY